MGYRKAILLWGFIALGSLLLVCFVYGLFNRFEFWHGAARLWWRKRNKRFTNHKIFFKIHT